MRSEELLEDALMIYEGRIRNAGIEIELRLDAKASLFCLEGEIRQVLNNLIGNAVDAMAKGGKLILHTADVTDWRSGRQGLRITVADTGTGMTPVTLKNIFEPFSPQKVSAEQDWVCGSARISWNGRKASSRFGVV